MMKKFLISSFIIAAGIVGMGCSVTPYAGMEMHSEGADQPEVSGLPNPVGVVGVKKEFNGRHQEIYVQHRSSIPENEVGQGYNSVGFKLNFPLEGDE